jgi:predicted glutamine amidotransferase
MCLIVRTQRDIPLTDDVLRDMHQRNADGYGFAYVKDGELQIEKNHQDNVGLFIETYKRTAEYEPVFHLRMRTHGDIDEANTHPYPAKYGIWVMHNGIIGFTSQEPDKTKSDTWHFIEQYLNPMLDSFSSPHDAIRSLPVRMALAGMVGSNRLVLSDNYGHVLINTPIWHKCVNPNFKGLLVSNTYAWKADQYMTPEEKAADDEKWQQKWSKQGVHPSQYTGYASNFGNEENDTPDSSPPTTLLTGPNPKFVHIKKNLYADEKDLVWKWTGVGFRRKAKFDTVWSNMKARRQSPTSTAPTVTSTKSPVQLSLAVSPPTGPTQPAVPALCLPPPSDPRAPGKVEIITPEAYQLLVKQTLDGRGHLEEESVTVELGTPMNGSNEPTLAEQRMALAEALSPDAATAMPTEEEYTEILVRDWQRAGKHSLNGMVYTDPDAAARVLEFVLPRVHV